MAVDIALELDAPQEPEGPKHQEIVKLVTSYWNDSRGLRMRKDIIYLRRRCTHGSNLETDADNCGAQETLGRIVNLDECEDGVYEVVVCNVSTDFETGYADDWNCRLVPVKEAADVLPALR